MAQGQISQIFPSSVAIFARSAKNLLFYRNCVWLTSKPNYENVEKLKILYMLTDPHVHCTVLGNLKQFMKNCSNLKQFSVIFLK